MKGVTALLLSGALLVAAHADAAAQRRWTVEPSLRVGGGHESDLVLDPAVTRTVVEGGPFLDLAPGLRLEQDIGPRTRLLLGTQATWERFLAGDDRWIYAQSLDAEIRRTGGTWRLSARTGAHYFDDSERPTVRRTGAGLDLRLGRAVGPAWLDLVGGISTRLYPKLSAPDEQGVPGDYRELGGDLGVAAGLPVGHGAWAAIDARWARVRARDPLFDSDSAVARLDAGLALALSWSLRAGVTGQWRRFAERPPAADDDQYLRAAVGVETGFGSGRALGLAAVWSRYRWPDGSEEDSNRLELRLTVPIGPASWRRPPAPSWVEDPLSERLTGGRRVRFAVHAPSADAVAVVGDFNGWDPRVHPLRRDEDGWWRTEIVLAPGTHQYLYLVDGGSVVPPDAERTVDDGFGGRNGLLVVPGAAER